MKNSFIFLLFILCSLGVYSQDSKLNSHSPGQSILSFSPTLLLTPPNYMHLAGGAKFQLFISKRFSIDGDLMISKDYFHVSPAVIGVPIVLLAFNRKEVEVNKDGLIIFLFGVVSVILSVEHLSYHIPVSGSLDISPFVSFLRYKYAYDPEMETDPFSVTDQLTFASGVQLNKYFGKFVFSPYAEYNVGYKDHRSGFNVGVYLGYFFDGRYLKTKSGQQ
jgi:hypothetical protein